LSDLKTAITRRQLLTGAGAGAVSAALGTIGLSASKAHAAGNWDYDADVVIIGSGVGASTAAVTAHDNGDSVLLVEKATLAGGTSAKSAGVLWIPNNFVLRRNGIDDRKDDCLKYLARFSYPNEYNPDSAHLGLRPSDYRLLEAFYDNAAKAVDNLQAKGAIEVAEWRMFQLDRSATDYLDHVPENKVPAGRTLGPVTKDGGIGLGAHLMQQLHGALQQRQVPMHLEHRAMRLVLNESGRVVGIEAEHGGKVVSFRARRAVIFATGGYAHNPALVADFQRPTIVGSCAMPGAEGDFLGIAAAVGAQLGNIGGAWRTQVVLDLALASSKLASGVFFPPGDSMIQVNKYGLRVVNEHRNYNDRTEIHGVYDPSRAEFPNQLLFMIYDQRTALAFGGNYPLPEEPEGADYVLKGDTLQVLSAQIAQRLQAVAPRTGGLSLDGAFEKNLQNSIMRFNRFAAAGTDEDFRRGAAGYDREWHQVFSVPRKGSGAPANEGPNVTMHPFTDKGPYFAIILAPGALDTNGGPVIDGKARVLDTEDNPIPGLYGAGNCIASPSREAYWGAGCTLGLSLTYGYIAGNAAHAEPRQT